MRGWKYYYLSVMGMRATYIYTYISFEVQTFFIGIGELFVLFVAYFSKISNVFVRHREWSIEFRKFKVDETLRIGLDSGVSFDVIGAIGREISRERKLLFFVSSTEHYAFERRRWSSLAILQFFSPKFNLLLGLSSSRIFSKRSCTIHILSDLKVND